MILFKTNIK